MVQATRQNRDTVITQYHRLTDDTAVDQIGELSNVRDQLVKVSRPASPIRVYVSVVSIIQPYSVYTLIH